MWAAVMARQKKGDFGVPFRGGWGGPWLSFAFLLVLMACTGKKRDFGDGPLLSGPFAAGASGVNDEADDALPVDALPVDALPVD